MANAHTLGMVTDLCTYHQIKLTKSPLLCIARLSWQELSNPYSFKLVIDVARLGTKLPHQIALPWHLKKSDKPFRSGQNELSNLHVCPEGCAWQTNGQVFESSEKEFQYRKLIHHKKDDEANHLLEIKSTVELMQEARKGFHLMLLIPPGLRKMNQ